MTSTNQLVDVVKFFSDHVFEDLQAEAGSVQPILQVDAIRYLYTFRNQVRLLPTVIMLVYRPDDNIAYERSTVVSVASVDTTSRVGELCLLHICGHNN